jgi:hypothetical protein
MSLVVKRSDRFPIGTVVSAYKPTVPVPRQARPAGTALETATVDAAGTLTFAGLGEGLYSLYAEVGEVPRLILAGNQGFTEPGTLQERIATLRAALGC